MNRATAKLVKKNADIFFEKGRYVELTVGFSGVIENEVRKTEHIGQRRLVLKLKLKFLYVVQELEQ